MSQGGCSLSCRSTSGANQFLASGRPTPQPRGERLTPEERNSPSRIEKAAGTPHSSAARRQLGQRGVARPCHYPDRFAVPIPEQGAREAAADGEVMVSFRGSPAIPRLYEAESRRSPPTQPDNDHIAAGGRCKSGLEIFLPWSACLFFAIHKRLTLVVPAAEPPPPILRDRCIDRHCGCGHDGTGGSRRRTACGVEGVVPGSGTADR